MDLHYLDVTQVKNTVEPMCIAKDGPIVKYVLLAKKLSGSKDICYTAISNNWPTLYKSGNLKIIAEFNFIN